jgi:hypothetical protein
VNKQIRNQWVAALRSGEYKQGKHLLRSTGDRYCCFGVLCEVLGQEWELREGFNTKWSCNGHSGWPPDVAAEEVGVEYVDMLVSMNDEGRTFLEIADYIEKNL